MLADGQDLGECQLGSGDERARRANSECRERRGRARLEKKRESRIKLYCKRRKNRSAAVVANGQGKCGLRQKESWGCWNDECSWAFEVRGLGRQRGTSGPSGRSWQMIGRGRLKRRVQASPPAIDGGRIAADGAQLPFRTLRRLSTLLALM